jgi:hypothetical protein
MLALAAGDKLLCLMLIMMSRVISYWRRDMPILGKIELVCLSPKCGHAYMYASIHIHHVICKFISKCIPYNHIRILHFHAFRHLHCYISFRYARCMRRMWCGTKLEDGVWGTIPKVEGLNKC